MAPARASILPRYSPVTSGDAFLEKEYGGSSVMPPFLRDRSQSLPVPMWSMSDWYLSFMSRPMRKMPAFAMFESMKSTMR